MKPAKLFLGPLRAQLARLYHHHPAFAERNHRFKVAVSLLLVLSLAVLTASCIALLS